MPALTVENVTSTTKENRVAAHSHVKGLGLKSDGTALEDYTSGFVGQDKAREVCDLHMCD
jgi:RuvB-like protein 1 (pontin 52)